MPASQACCQGLAGSTRPCPAAAACHASRSSDTMATSPGGPPVTAPPSASGGLLLQLPSFPATAAAVTMGVQGWAAAAPWPWVWAATAVTASSASAVADVAAAGAAMAPPKSPSNSWGRLVCT